MSKLFLALGAASVLGWLLVSNPAQTKEPAPDETHKLTVSSHATTYADPDAAMVTFAVTVTGDTSQEARQRMDQKTHEIKDRIAKLRTARTTLEVVPGPLNLLMAAGPAADGSQSTQGFQAETRFSVTIREKHKDQLRNMAVQVGDVAADLGGVGVTDLGNRFSRLTALRGFGRGSAQPPEKVAGPTVEWLCENVGAARAQAVKKALDEALSSARVISGSSKVKVAEVEVDHSETWARTRLSETGGPASGRVPVTVTVKVICSY